MLDHTTVKPGDWVIYTGDEPMIPTNQDKVIRPDFPLTVHPGDVLQIKRINYTLYYFESLRSSKLLVINSERLEFFKHGTLPLPPAPPVCTCNIMVSGCSCGIMEAERKARAS